MDVDRRRLIPSVLLAAITAAGVEIYRRGYAAPVGYGARLWLSAVLPERLYELLQQRVLRLDQRPDGV